MRVNLLYFASLRESLGKNGETLELPAHIGDTGALRDWLAAEGRSALATTRNLRCAINQEMADFAMPLKDGDEIAFFPPVTGG